MKADGTIIIDTAIQDDGMKAGSKEVEAAVRRMATSVNDLGRKSQIALQKQAASFAKLNQAYADQERKVKNLEKEVESYGNKKLPTQEYIEIQKQISEAERKLAKLREQQEKFLNAGGRENSNTYKRLQYDIDELVNTIKYAKGELRELESTGGAYTLGKDSREYEALSNKYAAEAQKLSQMNDTLGASYARVKSEFIDYQNRLRGIDKNSRKAAKSGNKLNRSLRDTKKAAKGAQMGIARMLATSILFSFVFQAISAVTTGIKEGFENLAQYSDDTNKALSMLMSSMTRLKNSFATAFSPLLEYVAPTLTKFIDLLSESATWVAQLFAALSGKDTYTRAVKIEEDYAAALKDSNKELEEREKENEKATFSFDQLIQAQGKSDTDDNGEYTPPTPEEMFVTEEVPNQIKLQADAIKQTFSDLFAPLKQSWDAYGPAVLASVSNVFSAIKQLAGDVGASFMQVWNAEGYGKAIADDLLITFANLAQTVANLITQFDKAWVAGDTGTSILRHLGDIILEITGFLREASDSLKNWAADLDFSPLLTSFDLVLVAIRPIVGDITDAILWLLNNALLPLVKWGVEQALPAVFDLIAAALGALHSVIEALKPLGMWLWENFLQPLGQWTGEVVIGAIKKLTEMLTDFSNWAKDNPETIENISVAILGFFSAWKFSEFLGNIAKLISKLSAFASGLSGILSPANAVLLVLSAFLIWLKENPEAVEKLRKVVEKLMETVGKFYNEILKPLFKWITETMWPILEPLVNAMWEVISIFFEKTIDGLENFAQILDGLIEFIAGVFSGNWERAWSGIKQIFSSIWDNMCLNVEMVGGIIEGIVDGIIGTIEKALSAINKLLGKSKGSSIDYSEKGSYSARTYSFDTYAAIPYRMPRLATGTVVPPRAGEFAAILGDNKRETEVVSPLSTMKQAFKEALAETGISGGGERDIHIELVLDWQRFARAVYKANNQETQRVGVRMVTNG